MSSNVTCACGCGESIPFQKEFANGILALQKKFEHDFITCYLFFKVEHADKMQTKSMKPSFVEDN